MFLAAAAQALEGPLRRWWPGADAGSISRVADTTARVLVSHGLAQVDSDTAYVASDLAAVLGASLDA